MSYFTERHGMREPIEQTSTITIEMYSLLFDCCEKYLENLAWLFPNWCPDGYGCCGLDYEKYNNALMFEIPALFRDKYNKKIKKPIYSGPFQQADDFDQYALLDFIEYIGFNCKDITVRDFHSYFMHNHINLLETSSVFKNFYKEINNIFNKTGLLYILTPNKLIERVVENDIISQKIKTDIETLKEPGIKELMEEAINLFKQPNPVALKTAVEKIWDALERLKTFYTEFDKKDSIKKIVNDMSNGQADFLNLFNEEFITLTNIGNNFRIRHHETDRIDITDIRHYDYFFNRCLSLISLAIQYLK